MSEENVQKYSPTEARLAEMKVEFFKQFDIEKQPDPKREGQVVLVWKAPLTGKDDPRFPAVMASLKQLTTCRTQVEQARQQFKREHLIAGRKIDADAAAIETKILAIETPIRLEKERVEALARAAAEAKVRVEEEKAAAAKKAEEAKLAAERKELADRQAAFAAEQAEAKRIADEAAAVAKKNADDEAAERKRQQDAIDAEQAKEKAALAAEAARIRAEQDALDRAKREKEIAEQAAAEATAKAEKEAELKRLAEESKKRDDAAAEKARVEREEAERKAEEEARPDVEKIHGFGLDLKMGIETMRPNCTSEAAKRFVGGVTSDLAAIAERCKAYGKKAERKAVAK